MMHNNTLKKIKIQRIEIQAWAFWFTGLHKPNRKKWILINCISCAHFTCHYPYCPSHIKVFLKSGDFNFKMRYFKRKSFVSLIINININARQSVSSLYPFNLGIVFIPRLASLIQHNPFSLATTVYRVIMPIFPLLLALLWN